MICSFRSNYSMKSSWAISCVKCPHPSDPWWQGPRWSLKHQFYTDTWCSCS